MVRLASTISRLKNCRILVAGDLMLDSYTIGKARRISPEAPVAVIQVTREEMRPGGAGNVALNLISLGASVRLLGRIGADPAGQILKDALEKETIEVNGLFSQQCFKTPIKNRIIADNQQVVRVDHEEVSPLEEQLEQYIIESIPALLADVDAVAISDYGKGFLTKTLLAALISESKKRNLPIITDPKGLDFTKYNGTTIIKPNLSEAYGAANLSLDTPLDIAAKKILSVCNADMLMVTRSEAGISVFKSNGEQLDFPVRVKEIKDVTGAGDTVLATLTCAIACGIDISEAAHLSNVAAGLAIERFGCARISLSDLAERLLDHQVTNKVFDDEHLFALQSVLKSCRYHLLSLSSTNGMTNSIYKAIKQCSGNTQDKLIIYIEDEEPDANFIELLATIPSVNYILVHGETLKLLCDQTPPHAVYSIVGENLCSLTSYNELLLNNQATR